jgi:hypothetical protein
MPDILYFVSGSQGQWELSDGDKIIGCIEQRGLKFTIKPSPGSILAGIQDKEYDSKQDALSTVEQHTGKQCKPASGP